MNRLCVTRAALSLATSMSTIALLAIPSWAATVSRSEATFIINHFSDLPLDVTALHDANTQAIAPDGLVKSNADADARFLVDKSNPASSQANGSSSSSVSGSGNAYFGLAQSVAQVIGYTFQIKGGSTFSFDFNNSFSLNTSIDLPETETAQAIATIDLGLYDSADPTNLILLDFLTISSRLGTPGTTNTLTVDQSAGITLSSRQTSLLSSPRSNQAAASASVQGSFSRFFASPASLLLVEYGSNQASVAAPEPSNLLALLLCIGLLGMHLWRKPKLNSPQKELRQRN